MKDLETLGRGIITEENLQLNTDKALAWYLNALTHDPESEKRIYQFLKMGKKKFSHDEL